MSTPVPSARLAALSLTLLATLSVAACAAHGSSAASQRQSSAEPVTLADLMSAPVPALCGHDAGNLVNGKLPGQDPHQGYVAISRRPATDGPPQVAVGDLTGDGVDDGVLVTACSAGGVGWPATVQVYGAGKKLLGGVDLGEVTKGGRELVTDLSISDGAVHVSWVTQDPGEAMCCGTVHMRGDVRVTGSSVDIEGVHRVTAS